MANRFLAVAVLRGTLGVLQGVHRHGPQCTPAGCFGKRRGGGGNGRLGGRGIGPLAGALTGLCAANGQKEDTRPKAPVYPGKNGQLNWSGCALPLP